MISEGQVPVSPGAVSAIRRPAPETKAAGAFRTISEVATDLAVPQHVLRFWESKFQQIRPLKRGGGRRYYRPEDISLLTGIKELLYTQGMTIRGVQKMLREGVKPQFARAPSAVTGEKTTASMVFSATQKREIEGVFSELKAMRELLRQAGI